MVNPEWGIKRTCHACGAKYYDFRKKTPVCPNCGTQFDPEALLKSRRRAMPEEKIVKPAPEAEIEAIEDPEAETEEAADDVLEDTEDLGDEAVEEVVEADEPEEER